MTFVSLPSAPEAPATPPVIFDGGGFYPDLNLDALRAAVRIDQTVTPFRLAEAAAAALLDVHRELATWRRAQELAGYSRLVDVPNPRGHNLIGNEPWSAVLFLRAVASQTAADLGERTRDAGTTLAGHDRADELEDTTDLHRRNYRWAINDLIGRPRTTIELI